MASYTEDPVWADVTPQPQDDGPNPVCPISYAPEYREAMDYFRAVYAKQEKSERVLQLTQDVVEMNAANYTVWQYRRDVLAHLGTDLIGELEYISEMIIDNPKNYQVWYHRRAVVEKIGDGSAELELTAEILKEDAKNYHAWQHRHWAMERFDLFSDGLAFANHLLEEDVRNNSAWNHRFFVIGKTTGYTLATCEHEVAYALATVAHVMENESAWNYIRGVAARVDTGLLRFPEVKQTCESVLENSRCCVDALGILLDIYELEAANGMEGAASRAAKLCTQLEEQDVVRANYWAWRATQIPLS